MQSDCSIIKWIKRNWIMVFIVLQPILDIIAFWTQSEAGTVSGYIRLAFMIALCVYTALEKRSWKVYAVFAAVILLFSLHVLNCFRVGYISAETDFKYVAKVIYLPLMAICFCCLVEKEEDTRQIFRGFMIASLIEAAVIVISWITGTYMPTYTVEGLGISGWVIESNRCCHSDIISALAVFCACYSLDHNKSKAVFLIPALIFVFLITNGTSACYLTLMAVTAGFPIFLFARSMIFKEKPEKAQRALMAELAGLFLLSLIIYPVTPRYKMEEIENSSYNDNEQRFAEELSELGYDIYSMSLEEKMNDPVVHEKLCLYYTKFVYSTVESMRDKYDMDRIIRAFHGTISGKTLGDTRIMKRMNAQFIFEDSDRLTRFLGFDFSNLTNGYEDLENDWYAIFYYYGYLGVFVYISMVVFLLMKIVMALFKNCHEVLNTLNFAILLSFVILLGLAFFSGAVFRRPNASIYLALIISLIWYRTGAVQKNNMN